MDLFSYLANGFDLPILKWIVSNLWCPFLDAVMPVITLLGDGGIFWIAVAAVCLFFPKTRKMGLSMGAALLLGVLLCNVTLKPLCARPRPYDFYSPEQFDLAHFQLLIEAQHDYSFPSGHTIASFEAATAILLYNKKLGIPAMVLACIIAFSRLYLFVHYPTDVLTSVVLGVGLAFLGTFLVKKGYALWEAKKKTA